MLAREFARQLRPAVRDSGHTLWQLAKRTQLDCADIAAALGGTRLLPTDHLDVLGRAVGLQLAFVDSSPRNHTAGPVRSVVDDAVTRVSPGRLGTPTVAPPTAVALHADALRVASVSIAARPVLFEFLECVRGLFSRLFLFSAGEAAQLRGDIHSAVAQGLAPPWFTSVEAITWVGPSASAFGKPAGLSVP